MALSKVKKLELVKNFRVHEKDTGSPEVQIALLTSIGNDGRKLHSGSAIFSESGKLYAASKATWIAVEPRT